MKSILVIDGNSVLFRAYYATVYSGGKLMKTSSGIPTNAVFGFVMMINKALELIQPDGVFVAWDAGKPTFRHEMYKEYKGTRKELDPELKAQFPIVREYLDASGIVRYEQEGIEADDIIGSFAKAHPEVQIHILSSDRDLLQLIDASCDVYLMKKGITEMQCMDETALMETMHVTPAQIIDLKALMGDSADNIPGVKGIGPKTAEKLLDTYHTVENVYAHLQELKGATKTKLEAGREAAMLSKVLATIKTDAQLDLKLEDMMCKPASDTQRSFFLKYEMHSFLKDQPKKEAKALDVKSSACFDAELLSDNSFLYADFDNENFYDAQLYGFALANADKAQYVKLADALQDEAFRTYLAENAHKQTFDVKNTYHALAKAGFACKPFAFDVMLAAFLADSRINTEEALCNAHALEFCADKESIYGKKGKSIEIDEALQIQHALERAKAYASICEPLKQQLIAYQLMPLYQEIELPLSEVLASMEAEGIACSQEVLAEIASAMQEKLEGLSQEIYQLAGFSFNIQSPKQLAALLYDELKLKSGKKRSTAADVLEKLRYAHPIVDLILQYRKYAKIHSTYAVALQKHIQKDGRIHTLFHQTLTQTGRLSSSDPNLQNISVRDEEGKEIRKAFIPSPGNVLISADYSQIELRMLAHMANETSMQDAFCHGADIHQRTAAQIFDVEERDVTSAMRRSAKTVNFGIIYGQSDYGLSEQLDITVIEAREFMEKYFACYPRIHSFMEENIAYCEAHGYVKTLFERRRYIDEIKDKNFMIRSFGKRAAMNAPIQGSAADLIKLAMVKIYREMKKRGMRSKMILQIHDELIFDVVKAEESEMLELIQRGMEEAMELSVPLVADVHMGDNWYNAK